MTDENRPALRTWPRHLAPWRSVSPPGPAAVNCHILAMRLGPLFPVRSVTDTCVVRPAGCDLMQSASSACCCAICCLTVPNASIAFHLSMPDSPGSPANWFASWAESEAMASAIGWHSGGFGMLLVYLDH